MLEVLDPAARRTVKTSTLSWQAVALVALGLGFSAFSMWLFASKFDGSELKTLLTMAGPVVAREFFPVIKRLLKPTTDMLAQGGQLE
jgi:drug/metabolite transporter (DMT)-like permease